MESEVNNLQSPNSLSIMDKEYLKEAAKWAKFLAIIGFIGLGLLVILAFSIGFVMNGLSSAFNQTPGFPMAGMQFMFTGIYLLMALLYFFPTLYLFNFSTKIQKGLTLEAELDITEAFKNLKSLFKFWGILTMVMLSFYAFSALIVGLIALVK